jgi:membrane protein
MNLKQNLWYLIKKAIIQSIDDNILKLSASLSYYTIFSLPPLLIIIIYLAGKFLGEDAVKGEIFGQINGIVGNAVALQIQDSIKHVKLYDNNAISYIIGIIILLIAAIGVFIELQESINMIWGLKVKPDKNMIKLFLRNRLISFLLIGSIGFLLLVGLIINYLVDIIIKGTKYIIPNIIPNITILLVHLLNNLSLFIIITLFLIILFRTLPDGIIAINDTILGASFTSFLFMIGKFAIGTYVVKYSMASIYGVAGTLIAILLWVYYSAIIFYFGVEFTKVYALELGNKIIPKSYAFYPENRKNN